MVDPRIGAAVRAIRTRLQITPFAAAELFEVSRAHLDHVESGRAHPRPRLVNNLRLTFGIDLYVYAWCRSGDVAQLPDGVRQAATRLTAYWDQQVATWKEKHQ